MKKILAIVLALVLCLSLLAACGSKDSGSAGSAGSTPAPSSGSTDAGTDTAPDTGSAPAAPGEPIKIGYLGPLSGGVAQYGIAVQNGVKLYVDQLNAAGGIGGRQIELVSYDEEGDATKAITGYNSLMDSGVVAIVGDVTTGPCTAVVAEAYPDNTPMITASATATSSTFNADTNTVYTNMFRSCFIDPFQGETMARFAVEVLGAKTAAVLYDNGDTYSTGVYEYFVSKAGELGLTLVAEESYATGAVDFSGQLTNIASKNPDVLFLPIYYNDVALVASQAANAGLSATLLGVDGWSSVLDAVTDPTLVEGAYYCSGYSAADTGALVQKFLGDYAAAYGGATPNMFDAQGYDAAWILCDAIAKAEQSGEAYGSDGYKQAIINAMKATDSDYVTGHVSYDEHNDPQKTAAIINIVGGAENFWGSY